jgi:FkbM family methyltransferase
VSGQHQVFEIFEAGSGPIPNWLGVVTRREFFDDTLNFVAMTPPAPVDSEYFEWIDLLESVVRAGPEYAMIELGAGYGRWTVNAAAAVRAYGRSTYHLVAVEAEPTHFEWLKRHCRDNRIDGRSRLGRLTLVEAAVTRDGTSVDFAVGDPAAWYGQAIADGTWSPEHVQRVRGVRLSDLVLRLARVDLIHLDIQGAELSVIDEAVEILDERTCRLHIGTHGAALEDGIRHLLVDHGWECLRDYPANATADTPWGPMSFQDGVQSWVNPRLRSPSNDT